MKRLFSQDSHASGDIGVILFVFILFISFLMLELAFGVDDITQRMDAFDKIKEPVFDLGYDTNKSWDFWDSVTFIPRVVWGIATYSAGKLVQIAQEISILLGILWDMVTFNLGIFGDELIVRLFAFMFIVFPVIFIGFYTMAKIVKGF